ncbi:alpha/beta fold hydrolase [Streptomyces globisporus]|uniref:alpha/beta fold hydrolase n=1 Tax=Streptomyces globisporus TaxID=1908 RepID=UPI0036488CD0
MSAYWPYSLDLDLDEFGLVEESRTAAFGLLKTVRSRERTSATCTLLLHGVASSWRTWAPLVKEGRRRGQALGDVVMVDLPGFGTSDNRLPHLDMATLGAELFALTAAFGYERINLVGHSMGGFLALDMASRPSAGRDRVASLGLAAAAYFSVVRAAQGHRSFELRTVVPSAVVWSQRLLAAHQTINRMGTTVMLRPAVARAVLSPFIAHPARVNDSTMRLLVRESRPESFVLAARNALGYQPREQWRTITVPVRAVFGARDRLIPAGDVREFLEVLPDCDSVVVRGASHMVHMERPGDSFAALFPEQEII